MKSHNEYMKEYMKTHSEQRKKKLKRHLKWRKNNKDKWNFICRRYARNNLLRVNGKVIKVRKRKFAGKCELCGILINLYPRWHHWNDKHPELGMWLCGKCHWLADSIEYDLDNKLRNKYFQLKGGLGG